ncbi:glutamate--cysteine ligase [Aeromonas phage ZPAH1]|nr:glutamate--cysteine ligase [Aeromonas phage ZPAH1]
MKIIKKHYDAKTMQVEYYIEDDGGDGTMFSTKIDVREHLDPSCMSILHPPYVPVKTQELKKGQEENSLESFIKECRKIVS